MIQINLVPDIKQEFLRSRRIKNVAISVSIFAGLASIGLVIALAIILGVQYGVEKFTDGQIKDTYAKLNERTNLSDIVTIQNQLATIPEQHDKKSMDSRLFAILSVVNPKAPNDSKFSAVRLIPKDMKLEIEGVTSTGYSATEAFKKTVENTKISYTTEGSQEVIQAPLATAVNISESNFAEDSDGKRVVRYKIVITYSDMLFVNTAKNLQIIGPSKKVDVTDSKLPDSLFTAPVDDSKAGE